MGHISPTGKFKENVSVRELKGALITFGFTKIMPRVKGVIPEVKRSRDTPLLS